MKRNKFGLLAAGCCGALLWGAPAIQSTPPVSTQADRYLMQIDSYAEAIQTHAAKLERLTHDPYATWEQYDRQWNEIKPAQEALQMRMGRLESMRASLSDSQRKMLDNDKIAANKIAWRTRQILKFMDVPGADLKSPELRSYARALVHNAGAVAQNAQAGA